MKKVLIISAIVIIIALLYYFFVYKKTKEDFNTRYDADGKINPNGLYSKDAMGRLYINNSATGGGTGTGTGTQNDSNMGQGAQYEDVNWWWTAIPQDIKTALSSVISQVANMKFPFLDTLSGNRTKLFADVEKQQFYQNFVTMVNSSKLLDYQKKQVLDATHTLLWDGVLKDVKASRWKKLASTAQAAAQFGKGVVDIVNSGEAGVRTEQ